MTITQTLFSRAYILKQAPLALILSLAALSGCGADETPPSATQTPLVDDMLSDTDLDAPAEMAVSDINEAELRGADSHVHGGAELALALDGSRLVAELESPLYNLVGFEHGPETVEQRAAVEDAEMKLSQPNSLFAFNSEAECAPLDMDGTLALFAESDKVDADHDHDHAHENEDEAHGEDDIAHRDFLYEYSFNCTSPDQLESVRVNLMTLFPLMTELDVVYLGPDSQKSFELEGSETTLNLRP